MHDSSEVDEPELDRGIEVSPDINPWLQIAVAEHVDCARFLGTAFEMLRQPPELCQEHLLSLLLRQGPESVLVGHHLPADPPLPAVEIGPRVGPLGRQPGQICRFDHPQAGSSRRRSRSTIIRKGPPISAARTQAEVQALRDKCEELADDVRALSTLVRALRGALVAAGVIRGGA